MRHYHAHNWEDCVTYRMPFAVFIHRFGLGLTVARAMMHQSTQQAGARNSRSLSAVAQSQLRRL